MDSVLSRLLKNDEQSFSLKESAMYHELNDFHHHPEIELIYVINGIGTMLINEQLGHINSGMMVMIGSNVPHMFKFDAYSYFKPLLKQGKIAQPIQLFTLHFDPKVFGDSFLNLPENYMIKEVFNKSLNGLIIHPNNHQDVFAQMQLLLNSPNHGHFYILLQLFTSIGFYLTNTFFTDKPDTNIYNKLDEQRLTRIYLYTLNNFTKTIKLKDVASVIYMSPNAFCRYFKTLTKKSYFEFLLEIKISYSCKLLKETNYSMVVVCYQSGFSNHSNFNRHFKAIVGKTPLEYRKNV